MKNYTKLFLAMYNIGMHVQKNYENIIKNSKINKFEYDDIPLLISVRNSSRIVLKNINENISLYMNKSSLELEEYKYVAIQIEDERIKIVKRFTENGDKPEYYMGSHSFEKIYFPLSNEDVFNIDVLGIPINLNYKQYNLICDNLDKSMFNMIFRMNTNINEHI